jgi:uncharacterized coiled-coil DUF342 family protein
MTDVTVEVPVEYRQELESCFKEMERLVEAMNTDRADIDRLRSEGAALSGEIRGLHDEVSRLTEESRNLKVEADAALNRLAGKA